MSGSYHDERLLLREKFDAMQNRVFEFLHPEQQVEEETHVFCACRQRPFSSEHGAELTFAVEVGPKAAKQLLDLIKAIRGYDKSWIIKLPLAFEVSASSGSSRNLCEMPCVLWKDDFLKGARENVDAFSMEVDGLGVAIRPRCGGDEYLVEIPAETLEEIAAVSVCRLGEEAGPAPT